MTKNKLRSIFRSLTANLDNDSRHALSLVVHIISKYRVLFCSVILMAFVTALVEGTIGHC